jgi:myosin heavy subunit
MMILGFSNTELKAIYSVLAAIIHLGHTKIVKKGKHNILVHSI